MGSADLSEAAAARRDLDMRLRRLLPDRDPTGPEVSLAELRRLDDLLEHPSAQGGLAARWRADSEDCAEMARRETPA